MAAACTCFLGNPDHDDGCRCTTTIMDCAVHGGSSPVALAERAAVEGYYAAPDDEHES
jgi:hypothetical protein